MVCSGSFVLLAPPRKLNEVQGALRLDSQQNVLLSVPAQPEFLRVVRVAASGLASRLGFSIDEVDDLRLALDELCFTLIAKGPNDGTIALKYVLNTDRLTIEGTSKLDDGRESSPVGNLSQQILTALVDEHRIWDEGNTSFFTLTKCRSARTTN